MRLLVALLVVGAIALLLAAMMPERRPLARPLTVDPLRVSTGLI